MCPWRASIRAIFKKKLWLWEVSGTQIQKNSMVTPEVPITPLQRCCLVITPCPLSECFDANPRVYTFSFINISAYVSEGKRFFYLSKNPKCHFTFLRNDLIASNSHQLLKCPWLSKYFFLQFIRFQVRFYTCTWLLCLLSLCYTGSAFLSLFSLWFS